MKDLNREVQVFFCRRTAVCGGRTRFGSCRKGRICSGGDCRGCRAAPGRKGASAGEVGPAVGASGGGGGIARTCFGPKENFCRECRSRSEGDWVCRPLQAGSGRRLLPEKSGPRSVLRGREGRPAFGWISGCRGARGRGGGSAAAPRAGRASSARAAASVSRRRKGCAPKGG